MLTWLFYLLMLIGVPLIFCLLIYRLKEKMPNGNIVIPIVMGVIAFQTILPLPFYVSNNITFAILRGYAYFFR